MIWLWKLEGGHVVDSIRRAQGFYSHPLTFAYVLLFFMPWTISSLMSQPRNAACWLTAVCLMIGVFSSLSATVIALMMGNVFFGILILLKGQTRVLALAACLLGVVLVIATPNPVSEKLTTVVMGERGDDETDFHDDRQAFWAAHIEMFKDAPVLGHGTGLEAEDRASYYAKIGLPDIKRKYEAHNMYLQSAVEGGFIPALALVSIILWLLKTIFVSNLKRDEKFYFASTAIMFALAGITQNAFQDSEVRYVFFGFIALVLNKT
jgi:O-antigen ligase